MHYEEDHTHSPLACVDDLFAIVGVVVVAVDDAAFCVWFTRLFDTGVDFLLVGAIATRFSDGGSEVVLAVDCIVLFGEYRLSATQKQKNSTHKTEWLLINIKCTAWQKWGNSTFKNLLWLIGYKS